MTGLSPMRQTNFCSEIRSRAVGSLTCFSVSRGGSDGRLPGLGAGPEIGLSCLKLSMRRPGRCATIITKRPTLKTRFRMSYDSRGKLSAEGNSWWHEAIF